MDLIKYIAVLVLFFVEDGESGGHGGGKHHSHVKLHMPEFIHHSHHTKVITIHHHHNKPKKEHHHHHHHHHHKPHQIPYGHHYQKHHTKLHTVSKTVTNGKHHKHGHHHGHGHHGHHGHHDHHGHHGHHGHHDDFDHHEQDNYIPQAPQSYAPPPTFNYKPSTTTFEEDFGSFSPAVPSYDSGISGYGSTSLAQQPRVRGISHTVKNVKVYDSLPGALPSAAAKPGQGYAVTEAEEDDDAFTAVNSLQQSYPGSYDFVRGVAPEAHVPYAEAAPLGLQTHDPFAAAPQPTSGFAESDSFGGTVHTEPFVSFSPSQDEHASVQSSHEFPTSFHADVGDFGSTADTYVGTTGGTAFADEPNKASEDGPVSYSRVAGIQESVNTGNVETIVY